MAYTLSANPLIGGASRSDGPLCEVGRYLLTAGTVEGSWHIAHLSGTLVLSREYLAIVSIENRKSFKLFLQEGRRHPSRKPMIRAAEMEDLLDDVGGTSVPVFSSTACSGVCARLGRPSCIFVILASRACGYVQSSLAPFASSVADPSAPRPRAAAHGHGVHP